MTDPMEMDPELKIQILEAEKVLLEQAQERTLEQIDEYVKNPPDGLWQPEKENKYYLDEIATINQLIAEWATDFATMTAAPWEDLSLYDCWNFTNKAGSVTKLHDGDVPQEFKEMGGAGILLDALTANHVYFQILGVPFFAARDSRMQGGGELQWLYKRLLEGDQIAAHKWRSETLRLLSHKGNPQLSEQTEKRIEQAVSDEVEIFLRSPVNCLLNTNMRDDFTQRLRDIFNRAAKVAHDLWRERCFVRCRTLGHAWSSNFRLAGGETLADTLKSGKTVLFYRPHVEAVVRSAAKDQTQGRDGVLVLCYVDVRHNE